MVYGSYILGLWLALFSLSNTYIGPEKLITKLIIVIWPLIFDLSVGTFPLVYIGEALPEIGASISMTVNWICGFLVA